MNTALLTCILAPILAVTSAGAPAMQGHWAFRPTAIPEIPEVQDKTWIKTPVDAFILAKLESEGLQPAPPADPRTLQRRLSYNLTGLPPTFEDIPSHDPHAAIEKLLASPHFGERWARHWLDVARYSDTKGYAYSPEEFTFVHAWLYRDWVVRAFNDDLPYDEFLLRQLAADRLLILDECAKSDLAAMGFLTLGRRFIGVEQDIIDDRIDVVTRGMLALTASCSRCHDHKFDPIPAADYYGLYGIFDSSFETMIALDENNDAELTKRCQALDSEFEKQAREAEGRFLDRAGDYLLASLDLANVPRPDFAEIITKEDLNPEQIRRWYEFLSQADKVDHPVFAAWKLLVNLSPKEFAEGKARRLILDMKGAEKVIIDALAATPLKSREDLALRYGMVLKKQSDNPAIEAVVSGPGSPIRIPRRHVHDVEWLFDESTRTDLKKRLAAVERRIIELGEAAPHAIAMEDQSIPENARVLLRGDYSSQGDEAPRRAPGIFGGAEFTDGSGRLELARSIASKNNPLTARVIVNRIWQHHFGSGLVNTPSDFGLRSEMPSHPDLLDYLAQHLIENDWSLKSVHRLITRSAVYQQASSTTRDAELADPQNRLLSHYPRRRLDFESMRDSLLVASGELDRATAGPPGELLGSNASLRRSLYGKIDRQFLPNTLRDFDFSNPELHSPQRHLTNVPQQALFFMNSPFVEARAIAFARRINEEIPASDTDRRIHRFFQIAYQREPGKGEFAASQQFISASLEAEHEPSSGDAQADLKQLAWRYGYGEFDQVAGRIKQFTPLPHFTGEAWGGGQDWPEAEFGWLRLTAVGGHAGNTLKHAAVRRWISPRDAKLTVGGSIDLSEGCGDGIRAMVISGERGVLAEWNIQFGETTEASLENIDISQGETLDFVVDCGPGGNFSCDEFLWAPTIRSSSGDGWSAADDFAGETGEPPRQLDTWERFAHSLLLTNTFMFID